MRTAPFEYRGFPAAGQTVMAPEGAAAGDRAIGVSDTTQELRFAVAMSGGVSLAVWMGGVAREVNLLQQASNVRQHESAAGPPGLPGGTGGARRAGRCRGPGRAARTGMPGPATCTCGCCAASISPSPWTCWRGPARAGSTPRCSGCPARPGRTWPCCVICGSPPARWTCCCAIPGRRTPRRSCRATRCCSPSWPGGSRASTGAGRTIRCWRPPGRRGRPWIRPCSSRRR